MKKLCISTLSLLMGVFIILSLECQAAKGDFIFGEPELVTELNSTSADAAPFITADGLELYFTSNRDHDADLCYNDIWMSTRARIDDPWETPINLGEPVNTTSYAEGNPCVSTDGLELYFSDCWPSLARACDSRPGGLGRGDIWVSTRQTRDDSWGVPVNLGSNINSFEYDGTPHLSADGLSLYFCSARSDGHGFDLYVSTRPTKYDSWEPAVEIGPPINTMASQDYLAYPFLSPNGLSLFFMSSPLGYTANGDIYISTRATLADNWDFPSRFEVLNSSRHDEGLTFALGDSTLYFVRSDHYNPNVALDSALATFDLYQVEVIPKVDLNNDGIVDSADVLIMIDHWHTAEPLCDIAPAPLGDGFVDIQDLTVLSEHLFEEVTHGGR